MDQEPRPKLWTYFLAWIGLLFFVSGAFGLWHHYAYATQQENIVKTQTTPATVILNMNASHHFMVNGKINGYPVRFIVDTGATAVTLSDDLADKLGLSYGFPVRASTASGIIRVYPTVLDTLDIGPIRLHRVGATINPHMPTDTLLLGMSALKRLNLEIKDAKLVLIQED